MKLRVTNLSGMGDAGDIMGTKCVSEDCKLGLIGHYLLRSTELSRDRGGASWVISEFDTSAFVAFYGLPVGRNERSRAARS